MIIKKTNFNYLDIEIRYEEWPAYFLVCFLTFSYCQLSCGFILGPQVPSRVSFHSMTSDSRVHAGGGVKIQYIFKKQFFCVKVFQKSIPWQTLIRKHSYLSLTCRVSFHSITSDSRVHARLEVKIQYISKKQYFCVNVFQKSLSLQPLIKKHSYLDHRYPVGQAFIPRHRTQGSMLGDGARG